jgi:hypothetical protein
MISIIAGLYENGYLMISTPNEQYSCAINIEDSELCSTNNLILTVDGKKSRAKLTARGELVCKILPSKIQMTKYKYKYSFDSMDVLFTLKMSNCLFMHLLSANCHLTLPTNGGYVLGKTALLYNTGLTDLITAACVLQGYSIHNKVKVFKFTEAELSDSIKILSGEFILLFNIYTDLMLALKGKMYFIQGGYRFLIYTDNKLFAIVSNQLSEIAPIHDTLIPSYTLITEGPKHALIMDSDTDIFIGDHKFPILGKNVNLTKFAVYVDGVLYYLVNNMLYQNDSAYAMTTAGEEVIYAIDCTF